MFLVPMLCYTICFLAVKLCRYNYLAWQEDTLRQWRGQGKRERERERERERKREVHVLYM